MTSPSNEKILHIANNFILHSPPGEFVEVVADVRALLPDEQLLNKTAPVTFRKYNTEQMLQVKSPNNTHQVLITQHGEVGESAYLDPRGKQVVLFDHIRQQVSGSRPLAKELNPDVEPFRIAFEQEAIKYVEEHYLHGATTVYGKKRDSDYQITIAIASSKFSPNNFWNGRWRSTWQVTFAPKAELATINGMVQVNIHYYEEGNVQLNNTFEKQLQSPVKRKDPQATAALVMKTIIKAEHAFHSSLDASYATMGGTTFKALRRMLPITVQKIDWGKIRALRMGAEIKRG